MALIAAIPLRADRRVEVRLKWPELGKRPHWRSEPPTS
jgi:hypothetical protein